MFKKAILAAATAGLIATGGIAATTTSAAAAQPNATVQFGGPGWNVQIGSGNYNPGYQFHHQKFCQPITKKVKWWDRFGYPHWSVVVVGQKCPPVMWPHNNGPFPPHNNGPFPPHGGNGGWNGNGGNGGNGGWNGNGGGNGGWGGNGW